MILALLLFWGSVAVILFAYLLFPAIIFLRGKLFRRPYRTANITPKVTLIIAAHNESEAIGAKLDNVLSLDYPAGQLEVLVASDGSDDGTNEIVREYARLGISLLALPRVGKAQALNAAISTAGGEILVFSDANSMYAADAIGQLTRPFADPEVGGVAGNQCYLTESTEESTGDGEKGYWSFDRRLKFYESEAGNTISATGAIYAIRSRLFQQVPDGVTDDFFISTGVIAQGFRLLFSPTAIAYEHAASSSGIEFGRKVRVITRGLQAVRLRRGLLNPFRYGFYAFQLFSHKLLRRLVVFPLIVLLLVSPFLWSLGLFYQLATLAQLGFYGLAFLGAVLERRLLGRSKILTLPFYFCMVNGACLVATFNIVRGRRIDRWEPQRHEANPTQLSSEEPVSSTLEKGAS